MKKQTLAFLLAIPVSCGLLASAAHHWYEKMNEAAMRRAMVRSEISRLYFAYCRDHGQPPLRLEDLEPYAVSFPKGFDEIRSQRWIILWGTPRVNAYT